MYTFIFLILLGIKKVCLDICVQSFYQLYPLDPTLANGPLKDFGFFRRFFSSYLVWEVSFDQPSQSGFNRYMRNTALMKHYPNLLFIYHKDLRSALNF